MKLVFRSCLYLSLLLLALPAVAETDIAGIKLPDHYSVNGQSLSLNGAGIRSKFFVKVYVGALYLENRQTNADDILAMQGAKSMQMHILYKEIEAKKITDGWNEGFRENTNKDDFRNLAERLETFNALFTDFHEGDTVFMNYTPGGGTELQINKETLGTIEGEDFFVALQKVWIGGHPADKDLKKGLLGN